MMIYWALAADDMDRQQIILGTSEEAVLCSAGNRDLNIVSNIDYTNYSDLLDFSIQETFEYFCENQEIIGGITDDDERTLWKKATVMCGGEY